MCGEAQERRCHCKEEKFAEFRGEALNLNNLCKPYDSFEIYKLPRPFCVSRVVQRKKASLTDKSNALRPAGKADCHKGHLLAKPIRPDRRALSRLRQPWRLRRAAVHSLCPFKF